MQYEVSQCLQLFRGAAVLSSNVCPALGSWCLKPPHREYRSAHTGEQSDQYLAADYLNCPAGETGTCSLEFCTVLARTSSLFTSRFSVSAKAGSE